MARDIDDVIIKLEGIVDEAVAREDRVGLFAALYLQVTRAVRDGIDSNVFDDGPRMNRFDTHFANRYLEALDLWRHERQPSRSWRVAFTAGSEDRHVILQHLLLGVNAHINLDLGIAAAATMPPGRIEELKPDFDRINSILSGVLVALQDAVNRHSPLMKVLDDIGCRTDEQLVNFNVREARQQAWDNAVVLARQDDVADERTIALLDRKAAFLGQLLTDPGPLIRSALRLIRMTESGDVTAIIGDLTKTSVPVAADLAN